jgi:hypothetical protein
MDTQEPEESENGEEENGQENAAGTGSIGQENILEKEDKGPVVQHPRTLPDGMPGADNGGPGTTAILQETGKKSGTDKEPVIALPAKEVDRKTELQGISRKLSPDDPSQVRRRTERDLKDADADIPYAKTERAVRDLVCSLIERQDRMNIDIFLEINNMLEDIGMLKDQVYKLKIMKTSPAAGAKK